MGNSFPFFGLATAVRSGRSARPGTTSLRAGGVALEALDVERRQRGNPDAAGVPSEVQRLRFIFPLPSNNQSIETLSFSASVIRKSVWGVVPLS
jgi:hypothetical protein